MAWVVPPVAAKPEAVAARRLLAMLLVVLVMSLESYCHVTWFRTGTEGTLQTGRRLPCLRRSTKCSGGLSMRYHARRHKLTMPSARRGLLLFLSVLLCGSRCESRVIFGDVVDRHEDVSTDTRWALTDARLENPREQDVVVRACCNIDLSLSIVRGARLHVCAPVLALLKLPSELIGPTSLVNYAALKGLRRLVIACSDSAARLGDPAAETVECEAAIAAGRAYTQSAGCNSSDVTLTRLLLGSSACVDTTRSSQVLMLEMPRHLYSSGIVTVHVAASRLGEGAGAAEAETHTLKRTFFLLAPPTPNRWQASLQQLIQVAPPLLQLRELAAAVGFGVGTGTGTDLSTLSGANVARSAGVFASAIYGGGTLASAVQVQELLAATDLHRLAQRHRHAAAAASGSGSGSGSGSPHAAHPSPLPLPLLAPVRPSLAYVTLLYSDGYAPGVAALAASLAASASIADDAHGEGSQGSDARADADAECPRTLLVMVGCKGASGRGVRLRSPGPGPDPDPGSSTGGGGSGGGANVYPHSLDVDAAQLLRLFAYDAPPPGWQPMVSRRWLDTLVALGDVLAAAGGHHDREDAAAETSARLNAAARQSLLARTKRHVRAAVGHSASAGAENDDAATTQAGRPRPGRLRIRLAFVPWLEGLSPGVPVIGLDAGVWMKLHAWALAPRVQDDLSQQQPQQQQSTASVSLDGDGRGRTLGAAAVAGDAAGSGSGSGTGSGSGSRTDGYDCLVFLDGDMLVHQSLEHLFRMPVCDSGTDIGGDGHAPSPSVATSPPALEGIAGVSVEVSDLESGSFNVGLLVLRPSLSLWRTMLFDHLAAHSKYQVIETSFLNAFFTTMRQGQPQQHPPYEYRREHEPEHEHEHEYEHEYEHEHEHEPRLPSEAERHHPMSHHGSIRSPQALTGRTYAWVLPLNYWCLAEVVARYDDPSLCATFDFSSCGVARWKPWLPGDPPTDEAGLLCRGKPPSPQYKALIAAWRGVYAAASDAVAATGQPVPKLTW